GVSNAAEANLICLLVVYRAPGCDLDNDEHERVAAPHGLLYQLPRSGLRRPVPAVLQRLGHAAVRPRGGHGDAARPRARAERVRLDAAMALRPALPLAGACRPARDGGRVPGGGAA